MKIFVSKKGDHLGTLILAQSCFKLRKDLVTIEKGILLSIICKNTDDKIMTTQNSTPDMKNCLK